MCPLLLLLFSSLTTLTTKLQFLSKGQMVIDVALSLQRGGRDRRTLPRGPSAGRMLWVQSLSLSCCSWGLLSSWSRWCLEKHAAVRRLLAFFKLWGQTGPTFQPCVWACSEWPWSRALNHSLSDDHTAALPKGSLLPQPGFLICPETVSRTHGTSRPAASFGGSWRGLRALRYHTDVIPCWETLCPCRGRKNNHTDENCLKTSIHFFLSAGGNVPFNTRYLFIYYLQILGIGKKPKT